jgi:DNA mismatch repair protein MutS2
VDLHGLSVDEAIAQLVSEIDRALLRGAERVEVVHGKGQGRIRVAVHCYLATLSVVAAFNIDPHNAGITWVHLR